MPARQQLVELMTLGAGLNLTSDPLHVKDTETPDALNVDFDQRGAVKKRMGFVQRGSTDTTASYDFLVPYRKADGTSLLILTRAGQLTRKMDTSYTISDITNSSQSASGVNEGLVAGDSAFIVNGVDGTLKFDGTTATRFGTTLGSANNHPVAEHIAYHKGRLFLGNTPTDRSRLYFTGSDANPVDLTFVKTTSFIEFDDDDGDEVTALVPFLDQLTVFKRNKIFTLRGNDPRSFTKVLNNPSLGCIAPRTAAAWDKGVIFLSFRGVFSFDGAKVVRVSERIDPALQALPVGNLEKATAFIHGNRYYLCLNELSTNAFNDTVFVFDFVTTTWTRYRSWEIHHGAIWNRVGGEEIFGADARTRNRIFQFRVGATDQALSTPSAPSLAQTATGGSLSNGTYRYKVTALNAAGETLASATTDITLTGGTATQKVTVTITAVPGATSYNVYGRTTTSQLKIANTVALTYDDLGTITPSGASPSVNTTDRINAYFTTKWLDFGVPERRKMGRILYVFFEAEQDAVVGVDITKNYQASIIVPKTVSLDPGGSKWGTTLWGAGIWGPGRDVIRERLRGLGTSTAFRIKVSDISVNPWTLLGLSFVLQPRNLA